MTMPTSKGRMQTGCVPVDIAFASWPDRLRAGRKQLPASGQSVEPALSRPQAGLPDLERALINPAAVFDTPRMVLRQPRLMAGCKREILRRWAWDEYLKEVAASEGMAEGEPSRLDEVKAALLSMDEVWRPKPSAPAAGAPLLHGDARRVTKPVQGRGCAAVTPCP